MEGAANIRRLRPDAVLIMLLPPSFSVQEKRLRGRGTETEEKIRARLARSRAELDCLHLYDYMVLNRDNGAEDCAEDVRAIVRAERCAVRRHPGAAAAFFEN